MRELRNGRNDIQLREVENYGWKTSEIPIDIDDSLGSVYAPHEIRPKDLKIDQSLAPRSWKLELNYLSQEDTLDRKRYDIWVLKHPDVGEPAWSSDFSSEEEEAETEPKEDQDSSAKELGEDSSVLSSSLDEEEIAELGRGV